MHRRKLLATTGMGLAAVLAGCSGGSEQVADNSTNGTASNTATISSNGTTANGSGNTTTSETETETAIETATETETPSGSADISIESKELVDEEGEYSTETYVATEVVNNGDGRSGPIELSSRWYNSAGDYLTNDSEYLQSLGAGETWAARVYALAEGDVADFKLEGTVTGDAPNYNVEGFELTSSTMEVGENEAVVTGKVKNNTGSTASYMQAVGTIYNADDVVLGDTWTNTTEVPADETWSFETAWYGRGRLNEADHHSVGVTDSAF